MGAALFGSGTALIVVVDAAEGVGGRGGGADVHNALVGYKKAISVFSVEDEMKAFKRRQPGHSVGAERASCGGR